MFTINKLKYKNLGFVTGKGVIPNNKKLKHKLQTVVGITSKTEMLEL